MTVADFLQLPPVRGTFIFQQFSEMDNMKYFIGFQLWHSFKCSELTVVVGENDKLFIDSLNIV